MKRIGLTGGIGSGKSYIAGILQKMGFPVYFSDHRAKTILQERSAIKALLSRRFGEAIFVNDELDKKALATVIFSSEENRIFINELIHPLVREDFDSWCKQQNSSLVFNESALLFETGSYRTYQATLLVCAPMALRIARVMERDGLNHEEVEARIQSQWSDERKSSLADGVIINDNQQPLLLQLETFIEGILAVKT
ncbi:MAG: dephospho-CoA kinase [Flavobacteriales bacterium]